MITRRRFLETLSALSASGLLESHVKAAAFAHREDIVGSSGDLTRYVNIAIGTGGHGHTYPGATMPFGMVQLSPDTYNEGWDWCSGYHYSDSSIMGFSHTHLSGTGGGDLLDFLLMPGTGEVKLVPGSRENPSEGYRSRFSHSDEVASPGYYSVLLKDYGIHAELTATERVGVHKYTFPQSDSSHFLLDLAHVDQAKPGVIWSNVKIVDDHAIVGGRSTALWANGRQIYFAMQFSKPFTAAEIVSEGKNLGTQREVNGSKSIKVVLHGATSAGEVIYVKTGISGVSIEGALKNLQAEVPGWDFDGVRATAHAAWQKHLAKIHIETKNEKQKKIFYTALYHMMVAPTLFDDVDGQYRGMDGKVHQLPAGAHNYSSYSLWDTFRAVHPMYTLILPERVPDFVNGLIRMANESPAGMPVWPLHGKETGTMTGYHSAAVIAEAAVKKFPGLNLDDAWGPMNQRAMVDDYRGLGYYRKLGFIPCEKEEESVSKTLEYTYDDWAVGHVARLMGKTDLSQQLFERAKNYRNVFDAKDRFMRPKFENGEWADPFDPFSMGHWEKWRDFTESNSWQTTFAIMHDPKGYIDIFGGREVFLTKLDALFNQSSKLPPDAPPDIAGLVGQYAHGNEPSHHISYLYTYAGAPWKTQARVRSLLETMYHDDPDGMAGNEDCGQMSAWFVISALGFYAVDPVSGNYVFGTPLFEKATLELANGKQLVIETKRESPEQQYVQSIRLNGKSHEKMWFAHEDIREGGRIVFTLGGEPNKELGASEAAAPPSLTA
jgi:predicted alpha-1,2-mannosidase